MRILNETIPSKHQGGVTLRLDRGHIGGGGEVHHVIISYHKPSAQETQKTGDTGATAVNTFLSVVVD